MRPPARVRRLLLPLHQASQRRLHDLSYLFFELTHACNLACLHCGSDCLCSPQAPHLPAETVLAVLRDVRTRFNPHKITVALTGDVGDEPFVGYPWHSFPERIWTSFAGRAVRKLPPGIALRSGAARLVRSGAGEQAIRIVGVVEDVVQTSADEGPRSAVYLPYTQAHWPWVQAVIRTDLPPELILPELRKAVPIITGVTS